MISCQVEGVEGLLPSFSFLIIVILYYVYQAFLQHPHNPLKHYINQHLTSFLKEVAIASKRVMITMYQYFKAKAKNPFVYSHPFFNALNISNTFIVIPSFVKVVVVFRYLLC